MEPQRTNASKKHKKANGSKMKAHETPPWYCESNISKGGLLLLNGKACANSCITLSSLTPIAPPDIPAAKFFHPHSGGA